MIGDISCSQGSKLLLRAFRKSILGKMLKRESENDREKRPFTTLLMFHVLVGNTCCSANTRKIKSGMSDSGRFSMSI